MRKSQVGTIIIWLIGVSSLALFLFLGVFYGEWNWGSLLFVVAFLGWGLERSIGGKTLPPKPAVKFGRGIVTAIVFGLGCLFVAIFVLMGLGTERHGNYEYYGQYPVLYVTPGLVGLLVGFFLPSLTFRTFVTASVSGVVCFFVAIAALLLLGLGGDGVYPALSIIPGISGIVGLFLPSLSAWVVRKARSQKAE